MVRQHCCIPVARWCVDIFYDTHPSNADEILDALWDLGCAERYLYKAEELLRSGVANEGLTFSNPYERRSIVVIGHTDDVWQFLDTLSHEKQHIEQAICKVDRLDPYGEDIAYISGGISASIARNAYITMRKLFLDLL